MQNITIGRYEEPTVSESGYAAWIEGIREDGSTWIMWLDSAGSPVLLWGQRDEGGGVEGDAIILDTASPVSAGYQEVDDRDDDVGNDHDQ